MMNAHAQQAGLLSGRSMTLIAVLALHALIISALIAIKIVGPLDDQRFQPLRLVQQPPPVVTPQPRPALNRSGSRMETQTVVFSLPPLTHLQSIEGVEMPPDASDSEQGVSDAATDAVTVTEPPVRIATALQFRIVRPSDDYYPDTSLALQEQGIAVVRVCVDATGRISGAPTIETGTGHKRLDQAAVRWARESLQFTPATVDGLEVPACKGFRVNFNLN